MSRLEDALRAYLDDPASDAHARTLAGVVATEASPSFLASMCRTLMTSPMVGPHDVALAAAAAYHRERAPLAKCETSSPARDEREGGSDVEADRNVQGRTG